VQILTLDWVMVAYVSAGGGVVSGVYPESLLEVV
jgi:hypothetical protein